MISAGIGDCRSSSLRFVKRCRVWDEFVVSRTADGWRGRAWGWGWDGVMMMGGVVKNMRFRISFSSGVHVCEVSL